MAVDLPREWVKACKDVYATLSKVNAKTLLSTYFDSAAEHTALLRSLFVDGLHIDLVYTPEQLNAFADYDKVLSTGITSSRNIWRANLDKVLETIGPLQAKLGGRL